MDLTLEQLIDHLDIHQVVGHVTGQRIQSVEFDSRKVRPGSLFVPLVGGATDGHAYIDSAVSQGAVATFWQAGTPIPDTESSIVFLVVADTLKAMQAMAHFYRQLVDPIVIGITGSNGKTTTKDMMANVLTAKYKVHKTDGNYNNEIGLPYTILTMPQDTEVLVCEMGMSNFGEIRQLSQIAEPNFAVITLIGESHLEFLKSRAGIAQAKLEIIEGMRPGGTLVIPAGEPLLEDLLTDEKAQTVSDIVRVGFDSQADVYAYDLHEEQNKTYFRMNLDPEVLCVIPVMGAYNVTNALFALVIAQALNEPIEQAVFQLAQFELTANRLEWLESRRGAQILNDAYNASPTSVRAVLTSFQALTLPSEKRRSVLLGDIRELGPDSAELHRSLADVIDPQKTDRVYLFGPEMAALYQVLQDKFSPQNLFYEPESHERLIGHLNNELSDRDVLLVKSSFGVDLLRVVRALVDSDD